MSRYKYKYSIIMAVYNVEEYIEEAVESLVSQKGMDFEEDIQVIMVNDGSLDNSDEVCKAINQRYPRNTIYINKNNGGVSSARNEGMAQIQGKYVNFLDPDDKITDDTLINVFEFFENNYEDIDLVAIPMYFFEAKKGPHLLNYKFKKTRIINLLEEYKCIQLSSSSAFIKSEVIKQYPFQIGMKYAEDALVINKILSHKMCYGVVSNGKYMYRRRYTNDSAIQSSESKKEWYTEYVKTFSKSLIDYYLQYKGFIPKYIQYLIMYDLKWRFKVAHVDINVLDNQEKEEFFINVKNVLGFIEDNILLEQSHIWFENKLHLLEIKYGKEFYIDTQKISGNLIYSYRGNILYDLSKIKLNIHSLIMEDKDLLISGYYPKVKMLEEKHIDLVIQTEQEKIYADLDNFEKETICLNDSILKQVYFKIRIPRETLNDGEILKLYFEIDDIMYRPAINLGKYTKLFSDMPRSYVVKDNMIIVYYYNAFNILDNTFKNRISCEIKLVKQLKARKGIKYALVRMGTFAVKELFKRKIWVFMDRLDKADDNAEVLYKYCLNKKDGINKVYIINKDASDYNRLKKIGKVIPYGGIRQKFFMLMAERVISSHVEECIRNPMEGGGKYLKGLNTSKFVFLQHGITQNDVSNWLNKYNKNLDLFITASPYEYQAILKGNYGYTERQVKLTGFARYDLLNNEPKNKIVIMPTWRSNIVHQLDQKKGTRPYSEKFIESDYFKFYNTLINDDRILEAARNKNYTLSFFPHPNIQQQIDDFDKREDVVFEDYHTSYNKIFSEANLIITDYSSIAFDFAYIQKPVIYSQFDYKDVMEGDGGTYSKGYFDYENMGFGPVCYEYEEVVQAILKMIQQECQMDDLYKKRVKNFYAYGDQNNCERIYKEIINME